MQFKRGNIGLFFKNDPTLKLWMPFEENSGTTALDFSGSGNHGTISGALRTKGKIGSGLYFDGTNDRIELPNADNLKITGDITILAWIKVNTFVDNMTIVNKGQGTTTNVPYEFRFYNGASIQKIMMLRADNTDYGFYVSDVPVVAKIWQLVGITCSATDYRLYIDGNKVPGTVNRPLRNNATDSINAPEIGARNNSLFFNGYIDEPAIFSRALSPKEISDYYLWSIGTPPQRRIFYVPINTSNFFHFFN